MLSLSAKEFLRQSEGHAIFDVRTPAEYEAGHLPGAHNLPLFSNDERAEVGTLYNQSGREESILRGLELAGPRLADFVREVHQSAGGNRIYMHCWRGGLRSASMGWLMETAGYEVHLLEGGYKAYRRFIRESLGQFDKLLVLGGKTGSGKTAVIEEIRSRGRQVLDLENIAHHKGSAFGDLGQEDQPTNEQFENNLYDAISKLDANAFTFVEDESRGIGRISIPDPFFSLMRTTEVIFLDVPRSERVNRLVREYAEFPKDRLASAINRISKKLGGLNTGLALEALGKDDFMSVADILLQYYDKAYMKGLSMRNQAKVSTLTVTQDDPVANAKMVLDFFDATISAKIQEQNLNDN